MKTICVLALSLAVSVGAFAANRLAAQTTGTSESGVPPATTVFTQDPAARTIPTPTIQPAQSTTTIAPPPVTSPTTTDGTGTGVPVPGGTAAVQNIVELTRLVPPGTAAVTAFTVPAGVTLIVTDLLVTNTGSAPSCGAAVNRTGAPPVPPTNGTPSGAPTGTPNGTNGTTNGTTTGTTTGTTAVPAPTPTATVAGTVTQTDSTVTGPLCVPAQTTTTLPLTTGIEFAAGQSVQLFNVPDAAAPAGTTPGALGFHLRGLLVTLT
jgi:hypothetical protein